MFAFLKRAPASARPSRACSLIVALGCLLLSSGCKRVLLDERFHDDRLVNWTVIDEPDALEGPSEWRVEQDGWLHQRSNIWGLRGDFLGRWYGTSLVAGNAGWSDYSLSVKVKPVDDDGFGILFRIVDGEHFYRLLFVQDGMSGGPFTRLDKREGPNYTELWSTSRGYRPGAEMTVQVEVDGETIRAALDGTPLFQVKDSTYSRGKIGLFCYAQKGQAFDEVMLVGW